MAEGERYGLGVVVDDGGDGDEGESLGAGVTPVDLDPVGVGDRGEGGSGLLAELGRQDGQQVLGALALLVGQVPSECLGHGFLGRELHGFPAPSPSSPR
nr:MAG TPA: hypothetical protein [Caudoviricetes sp.]